MKFTDAVTFVLLTLYENINNFKFIPKQAISKQCKKTKTQ